MAIHDDWISTKQVWGQLSFPVKVFLGITLLANLMSGFSLLSQVTALSGFILEGYKFYMALTEPIRDVIGNWISMPRAIFDTLVIALTIQGAVLRARAFSAYKDYVALFCAIGLFVVWAFTAAMNHLYDRTWLASLEEYLFFTFIGVSVFAPLIIGWLPYNRESVEYSIERLTSGYILGLAILIGALGAISKGLQQGFGIG